MYKEVKKAKIEFSEHEKKKQTVPAFTANVISYQWIFSGIQPWHCQYRWVQSTNKSNIIEVSESQCWGQSKYKFL